MALASRKSFAQVILLVILWIAVSNAKNIVIGLLGDLSAIRQDDQQNYKFFPEPIEDDLAYESSNWILDGPHDFTKIFHAVKQKFGQLSNRAAVSFTFRQIPFSSGASLNSIISLLYENKETCDAFVFGFFAENRLQTFYKSRKLLCDAVDALVTELNIATFSWSCMYKQHFDKVSSMISLLPAESTIGKSVTSILHYHKWRKVAFLTTSWPDEWNGLCNEIEHQIMSSNYFSVQYYKRFAEQNLASSSNFSNFRVMWTQLQQARVSAVVVCVPQDFTHQGETTFMDDLLESAYEVDAKHAQTRAFLLVDWNGIQREQIRLRKPTSASFSKSRRSTPVENPKVYSSSIKLSRVIGLTNVTKATQSKNAYEESIQKFQHHLLPTSPWDDGLRLSKRSVDTEDVKSIDKTIPFEILYENVLSISPSLPPQPFTIETNNLTKFDVLFFMDSLLLSMAALSEANYFQGNKGMSNGRFVVEKASDLCVANGFTGRLCYNPLKQRKMNFTVWDIVQHSELKPTPVMIIDTFDEQPGYFKVFPLRKIVWSPNGHPVSDTCDTLSFLCHVTSIGLQTQDLVIVLFCGTGLYLMIYGAYIFLRKKKEWQILLRGPNKLFLNDGDLKFLTSSSIRQQQDSLREVNPHSSRIGSLITLTDQNLLREDNSIAMLKGDYVFLKKICALPCELKKGSHDSLRQIKELRHENLCVVHGLYTSTSFHFLVTEYGHRRSLKELIENRDCELNWTFKVSLLHDLVRGMKYLHSSPVHCHGRLKSRNCAVDGRFVLKITDYGVNRLKNSMGSNTEVETDPKDLLWTAPELLNDPALRQIGTQKGDSYSFAIICQELILREDPFSMINLSPDEIIEKLKKPPPLLRPSVQADAAPIEIIQIMKQCWQEQPELRLTFSAVHSEIKRMNRGKKHNIVEDMMKQLEDYSSHLEELVNERTAELKEEKKKTEQLLMRMLPPSVAKLLMANQKIIPETFDHCTIYFSDICGFTTIAHASSPMQVVDFLNDLYTCFDAIIERYEIYKVETIGDAYMVSSGIPKVIGDRHAEEAALMALDIMSATTTFRIRHLPDVDVRIRIGMHSGPAVAGVVGLTMPRYCLFGDTINTASRLETTGIPSRIHISSDTKESLDKSAKEFTLQKRGTIELKGRGKMETWWLLGMKGFTKPLPNPGDINGPSHGIKIDKPSSSENQSSNNSKSFSDIETSIYARSDKCKMLTQRNAHTVRSGGSSFVVATPLALVPKETLKPRYDWFQARASDKNVSPSKTTASHKVRRCQVSTVMNRNKSIAPSCLYSPSPKP